MAIRVSGLVSGLDTDSIVQELVAAYSTKKDKHVKAQTKLEWKMDAWKDLNKKVNSLYKRLGNMKLSTYYNKKKTTISDSTKATVTASNNAINGTQTLKVKSVAQTGYLTGAQLAKGTTGSTTLGELGLAGDGTVAVKTKNGTTNIDVTSKMTISDFVNKLKDAGVSASFDSTYGRMYISAKDSGVENDFALTAADANGLDALRKLGVYVNSPANQEAYSAWDKYGVDISGNATTDPDAVKANIKNILDTIDQYQGTGTGSISELEEKNTELRSEFTNLQADRNYATAFISVKSALAEAKKEGKLDNLDLRFDDPEKLLRRTDAELEEVNCTEELKKLQEALDYSDEDFAQLRANALAMDAYENDEENKDVVQDVKAAYDPDNPDDTKALQAWVDKNSADITAVSDKINANSAEIVKKQAYIADNALLTSSAPKAVLTEEQKKDMTPEQIADFEAANSNDVRAAKLAAQYQNVQTIKNDNSDFSDDASKAGHAVRVNGSDAAIELNGVEYVSASNNITVNGITITALQKTAGVDTPDPSDDEVLTITTQADAQGIYDAVKSFLKEYNALIKEMDELYNAASSKGYEPLTDDEKDAMSDKEIERWEEKIKKSILRRDDTLSSVMNLMTSTMMKGFTLSDGKRYSLASFGIKTQGYLYSAENEGNVYHIDGDSEDEVSAGNADRLLAAIQENPEMVQEFFQKLSDDLYTKLDKKMQSTTMNSKYSIYNDKKMQRDYDEYTKTIKKWEEKVTSMEDYYYKKFAAMEKALSSLQQSTSALSGLLGS